MKTAVAGGTGLVGRQTVEAVRRVGHDPVVLARSAGVDLTSGAGLAAALDGVDAVIDVTNTRSVNTDQVRAFFATVTEHLVAAEHHAGVRHHVALSIVGLDRLPDDGHYAGKREQERLALSGPVPASVVRATQFFDFAAQMVGWMRRGQSVTLPPLLVQRWRSPTSPTSWSRSRWASPSTGSVSWPAPRPRIWSTWPAGHWRRAASSCG